MRTEEIKRGKTYVTESGKIRRVDQLEGPPERRVVGWRDISGANGGRCDIEMFGARVIREATAEEVRRAEKRN